MVLLVGGSTYNKEIEGEGEEKEKGEGKKKEEGEKKEGAKQERGDLLCHHHFFSSFVNLPGSTRFGGLVQRLVSSREA
jgi:hypothetical protein